MSRLAGGLLRTTKEAIIGAGFGVATAIEKGKTEEEIKAKEEKEKGEKKDKE